MFEAKIKAAKFNDSSVVMIKAIGETTKPEEGTEWGFFNDKDEQVGTASQKQQKDVNRFIRKIEDGGFILDTTTEAWWRKATSTTATDGAEGGLVPAPTVIKSLRNVENLQTPGKTFGEGKKEIISGVLDSNPVTVTVRDVRPTVEVRAEEKYIAEWKKYLSERKSVEGFGPFPEIAIEFNKIIDEARLAGYAVSYPVTAEGGQGVATYKGASAYLEARAFGAVTRTDVMKATPKPKTKEKTKNVDGVVPQTKLTDEKQIGSVGTSSGTSAAAGEGSPVVVTTPEVKIERKRLKPEVKAEDTATTPVRMETRHLYALTTGDTVVRTEVITDIVARVRNQARRGGSWVKVEGKGAKQVEVPVGTPIRPNTGPKDSVLGSSFPPAEELVAHFVQVSLSPTAWSVDVMYAGECVGRPFRTDAPTREAMKERWEETLEKYASGPERRRKQMFEFNSARPADNEKEKDMKTGKIERKHLKSAKDEKPAKKEKTERKAKAGLFGQGTCAILRWCGKKGMSVDEAVKALAKHGIEANRSTATIQVKAGKSGDETRGPVPKLSSEDGVKLLKYKK